MELPLFRRRREVVAMENVRAGTEDQEFQFPPELLTVYVRRPRFRTFELRVGEAQSIPDIFHKILPEVVGGEFGVFVLRPVLLAAVNLTEHLEVRLLVEFQEVALPPVASNVGVVEGRRPIRVRLRQAVVRLPVDAEFLFHVLFVLLG